MLGHIVLTVPKVEQHKYLQACQDHYATFTPLCISVDGTYAWF